MSLSCALAVMAPHVSTYITVLASERGLAPQSIEAYERDLTWWQTFVDSLTTTLDTDPGEHNVTLEHHADFFHFLHTTHQLSARSIARIMSGVRGFFRFLVSQGLWSHDPWVTARHQRYPTPSPHPLSENDIKTLLTTIGQDTSPEGRRLSAVIELLYATGLRISELLTLPLLSLGHDTIQAVRITGKGGHERFIFVTPQACSALHRYLDVRGLFVCGPRSSAFLFPSRGACGHLTRQRVGQSLSKAAALAGLSDQSVSPHGLRHAFATHLLHRGVDLVTLKELLGHRDISTTQLYTHVKQEQWAQILAHHHPLGNT